jgi:hypothetical protein
MRYNFFSAASSFQKNKSKKYVHDTHFSIMVKLPVSVILFDMQQTQLTKIKLTNGNAFSSEYMNSRFSNCKHTPALVSTQELLVVKTSVFSHVMLRSLVYTDRYFKGTCCIHLQTLMEEAAGSFEMLVNIYQTTSATFHKPVIFSHCCGNLKSPCNMPAQGQTSRALIPATVTKVYHHQAPQFLHRCQQTSVNKQYHLYEDC